MGTIFAKEGYLDLIFTSILVLFIIFCMTVLPAVRSKKFKDFKKKVEAIQKFSYIKVVFDSCVNLQQLNSTYVWAQKIDKVYNLKHSEEISNYYLVILQRIQNV